MIINGGNIRLKGEIEVPGDKSISHRAIMLGAIAEGKTVIKNFLHGDDCLSTIRCFQDMGVNISFSENNVVVDGVGLKGLSKPENALYVGNSGTTIRLMSGILSGQDFNTEITGDNSILKRPMYRIIKPLKKMGADIYGKNDKYPPLIINPVKNIKGIKYELPVASAQVKSCILLAGLYSNEKIEIIQPSISRDHSERMLKYFGVDIEENGNCISLNSENKLKGNIINVPGDISSAAFFIVAALILEGSELSIKNVGLNVTRTGILDVLKKMNANIKVENIRVENNEPIGDIYVKHSNLIATEISGDIIPRLIDEIPIIAVAASLADGETVIKDAKELKVKESNRISAMVKELKKMGVNIEELEDGMVIRGSDKLYCSRIETYNDHRVAMSLSIAALYAEGESELTEIDSISVSFPNFFDNIKKIMKNL